ncbi:MAG: hypothetical protein ACTS4T_01050 [Candidatus Hodgkinia cicadicola]
MFPEREGGLTFAGESERRGFVRVLGGDSAVVLRFGGAVNVSEVRRGMAPQPQHKPIEVSRMLGCDLAKHKCGLSSQVGV